MNLEQIHAKIIEALYAASMCEVDESLGDLHVYLDTIANLTSLVNFKIGKEMQTIIDASFEEYQKAFDAYKPPRREVRDSIQEQYDLQNFYGRLNRNTRQILIDMMSRILAEEEILRT